MDLDRLKDHSLYGRLWAASLGIVDLVEVQKKISRMEEIMGEDMTPITYDEMREIWALELMGAECSYKMVDMMLERESMDDMIDMHLSESEWKRWRRGHEDADMYDVLMEPYDDIWYESSDDEFSDDDGGTSCTYSTDEPLTLRDGSVRDISVDDSLSEEGEGKSTEEPDDEVASQ
jgi:hypothetical protein